MRFLFSKKCLEGKQKTSTADNSELETMRKPPTAAVFEKTQTPTARVSNINLKMGEVHEGCQSEGIIEFEKHTYTDEARLGREQPR